METSFRVTDWLSNPGLVNYNPVQENSKLEQSADYLINISNEVTLQSVANTVCGYFGVTFSQVNIKTRKREIVQVRQWFHYFSRKLTKKSLAEIGLFISHQDHATALNSIKTINNLVESYPDQRQTMNELYCAICNVHKIPVDPIDPVVIRHRDPKPPVVPEPITSGSIHIPYRVPEGSRYMALV